MYDTYLLNHLSSRLFLSALRNNHISRRPICFAALLVIFAARCYASAAYAVSICPSVRHVRSFCQNESTYLQNFLPSGGQTILVFAHQTL